ncbi:Hypothetical protein D9617_37g012340 [Elsinoe fawcettii]|nr:Hypothetical protein D9617_37g012340 [Elsinoe fawcettii]
MNGGSHSGRDRRELPQSSAVQDGTSTSAKEVPFTPSVDLSGMTPKDFDHFFAWYLEYCHVYQPVISRESFKQIQHKLASGPNTLSAYELVVLFAILYAASVSIEAWDAQTILARSASLSCIRAAILLALPRVSERITTPDPSEAALLVRAIHMAGLHQDPATLGVDRATCRDRRTLFSLALEVDVSFSVAHGLPSLLRSAETDVKSIFNDEQPTSSFLAFRMNAARIFEKIILRVYGTRRCLESVVVQLNDEVQSLVAEAATLASQCRCQVGAAHRFVAYVVEEISYRSMYILNQPYLRDPTWGSQCRLSALRGAIQYIKNYTTARQDFIVSPFNYIFNNFNVYHPCAILLLDLIKNLRQLSYDRDDRAQTVQECFAEFYDADDPQ